MCKLTAILWNRLYVMWYGLFCFYSLTKERINLTIVMHYLLSSQSFLTLADSANPHTACVCELTVEGFGKTYFNKQKLWLYQQSCKALSVFLHQSCDVVTWMVYRGQFWGKICGNL